MKTFFKVLAAVLFMSVAFASCNKGPQVPDSLVGRTYACVDVAEGIEMSIVFTSETKAEAWATVEGKKEKTQDLTYKYVKPALTFTDEMSKTYSTTVDANGFSLTMDGETHRFNLK